MKYRNRKKQFLFNQISLTKTPEIIHPADSENTSITQFKIKITEIPHEKLTNTAVPQTPMPPLLNWRQVLLRLSRYLTWIS